MKRTDTTMWTKTDSCATHISSCLSGDDSHHRGTTNPLSAPQILKSCLSVKTMEESLDLNNDKTKREIAQKKRERRTLEGREGQHDSYTVAFGHVAMASHPIILGNNPAVSSGAPLTIDWYPCDTQLWETIEEFERERSGKFYASYEDMKITPQSRFNKLVSIGFSPSDVRKRIKQVRDAKSERLHTRSQLHNAKSEEKKELLVRSLRNVFTNKKKKERAYLKKCLRA